MYDINFKTVPYVWNNTIIKDYNNLFYDPVNIMGVGHDTARRPPEVRAVRAFVYIFFQGYFQLLMAGLEVTKRPGSTPRATTQVRTEWRKSVEVGFFVLLGRSVSAETRSTQSRGRLMLSGH